MKRYLLFLGLLLMTVGMQAQMEIIDKVIATVGGEYVLLSELEEQYSLMQDKQASPLPPEARCVILDQLLVGKLLLNQSKLDSVEVTDDQVEEQLNARIERILDYMQGDVTKFEEYYGQTITEVKEQFREDLRSQLLIERLRGQVLAEVEVTPSEVKAFFEKIPQDSLPYFNSEVEIREIVYVPKANGVERKKVTDQLQQIRDDILAEKVTFDAMAQKYSDDGSARDGGDLGWARRGKFVPEFEAAAYRLEPGEISEIIETQFGFHIIQLLDRRGNTIRTRHILLRPEVTDDDLELAQEHLDSIRQLVLVDSVSFSVAVKRFGDEDVFSYNNDGRMFNPTNGSPIFEVGDLDPDIYFAIDTMDVNGITSPLAFVSPLGETHYRIVRLDSRTKPHRANLQQDYHKIQQATKQSRQNEYLNGWIETRIKSTYIDIDPRYGSCESLDKWAYKRESTKPVKGKGRASLDKKD